MFINKFYLTPSKVIRNSEFKLRNYLGSSEIKIKSFSTPFNLCFQDSSRFLKKCVNNLIMAVPNWSIKYSKLSHL